jgi:FAD binding domain
MNTGIGDAVNLAWKLAAVLKGRANESLLHTYEPERIAFARRLVATTDQAFAVVTSSGAIARLMRLHIVPVLISAFFTFRQVRRFLFLTVSQTRVNYRGSPLSQGRAGSIHGGDRLPWVPSSSNSGMPDNFAPLQSLDWQAHVYGEATSEVEAMCHERRLPLHVFPWRQQIARTGLKRSAVYVIRPDGYVALANAEGSAAAVSSYFETRR